MQSKRSEKIRLPSSRSDREQSVTHGLLALGTAVARDLVACLSIFEVPDRADIVGERESMDGKKESNDRPSNLFEGISQKEFVIAFL